MHALSIGFGLGFLVAMQLGPMSLFLIRSTLRSGWAVGLAIGAGIAVVDALYAAAGAAGAASLLAIDPLRTTLSLLGAAVLLFLGIRTLRDAFRVRLGAETEFEVASPRRAFATSAAATASNPLTIASWGAVFAAASRRGRRRRPDAARRRRRHRQPLLGHAAGHRDRGGAPLARPPRDARSPTPARAPGSSSSAAGWRCEPTSGGERDGSLLRPSGMARDRDRAAAPWRCSARLEALRTPPRRGARPRGASRISAWMLLQ